jgi:hypothetical protein
MAINTRQKRWSASSFTRTRPVAYYPDGSLADTGDRPHLTYIYRGLSYQHTAPSFGVSESKLSIGILLGTDTNTTNIRIGGY